MPSLHTSIWYIIKCEFSWQKCFVSVVVHWYCNVFNDYFIYMFLSSQQKTCAPKVGGGNCAQNNLVHSKRFIVSFLKLLCSLFTQRSKTLGFQWRLFLLRALILVRWLIYIKHRNDGYIPAKIQNFLKSHLFIWKTVKYYNCQWDFKALFQCILNLGQSLLWTQVPSEAHLLESKALLNSNWFPLLPLSHFLENFHFLRLPSTLKWYASNRLLRRTSINLNHVRCSCECCANNLGLCKGVHLNCVTWG